MSSRGEQSKGFKSRRDVATIMSVHTREDWKKPGFSLDGRERTALEEHCRPASQRSGGVGGETGGQGGQVEIRPSLRRGRPDLWTVYWSQNYRTLVIWLSFPPGRSTSPSPPQPMTLGCLLDHSQWWGAHPSERQNILREL